MSYLSLNYRCHMIVVISIFVTVYVYRAIFG